MSTKDNKFRWNSYGTSDSNVYNTKDFRDVAFQQMYGNDFSRRNLRKFNRYLQSDKGRSAWEQFDQQQGDLYMEAFNNKINQSHANFRNMVAEQQKQRLAVVPETNVTEETSAAPVNQDTPAPAKTPAQTPVQTTKTPAPANNTSKQPAVKKQQVTPSKQSNKSKTTYGQKMTLQQFRNHKNFRRHYGYNNNATIVIDGKTYPIMVSTGTYNPGSKDRFNDHTYALDEATGMVRAVDENWLGMPTGRWKDGANWIIFKKGGILNKYQQGGVAPQQQDMQQQVVALVQAAMQGDQQATETVNQIMEAAKAGDQQAAQIAQMIQQVAQQMQGQATAAKWGAKLGYIRSLKFANGGKTCPACQQGTTIKKPKTFTLPNKKVEEKTCGGKAKKHQEGGFLSSKTYPEAKYGFITREQIPTRKGNVMNTDLDNTPRRVILEKTRRMPNGEFVNDTLYFRNKLDQNKALLPRYGMSDPDQLRYKFGALDYFGNPKENPNKTAFESYLK